MARTTFNNGGMEEKKKKGPTFFKIIKTDFNTEDLRIPPKFWKHLWNELSNKATLNLKDLGWTWTVSVTVTEGEIYFKKGWEKFIRDNSLGDYEFLEFRYESDMRFDIKIFERTGARRVRFPDVISHRRAAGSCLPNKLEKVEEVEEDYQANIESPTFTRITGENSYSVAIPADFSAKYHTIFDKMELYT